MTLEIKPTKSLHGEVTIPGDKSISHRALMFSALANGTSTIKGILGAADPKSTRRCLEGLGTSIVESAGELIVHGKGLHGFTAPQTILDAGNSGTTIRLLSGILAGQNFTSTIEGDASLNQRPMRRIIAPLESMGARIRSSQTQTAPLTITGRSPLAAIEYAMPINSAQVKSAILLAGLYAEGTTIVRETVKTRDHTERMLGLATTTTAFGAEVAIAGGLEIAPKQYEIPGDFSSAAFLLVAGLVVPKSEILIRNVGLNPTRATFLEILRNLGGSISEINHRFVAGEPIADLLVRSSDLQGDLTIESTEAAQIIDEIPILSAAMLFAKGSMRVKGATELRAKESDRIHAITYNLKRLGVEVEEYEDGFAFESTGNVTGTIVESFHDHRIAMAFGIAGLRIPNMCINNPECVDISYPGFWVTLSNLSH